MSTCSACQGTGEVLPAMVECCPLCRGSGSRVPYPISGKPLVAAREVEALAEELLQSNESSPYKAGHLAGTLHQVAELLRSMAGV